MNYAPLCRLLAHYAECNLVAIQPHNNGVATIIWQTPSGALGLDRAWWDCTDCFCGYRIERVLRWR